MAKPSQSDLAAAFGQAVAHFRKGAFDDAEKICARMLKAVPGHFDVVHLLGLIKLQSGKPAAAIPLFESALKADPRSPEALSNLALALATLARYGEALPLLEKAHALQPQNIETLNNRGNVLLHLQRVDDALKDFDRVLLGEPRHLGARLNRGNALVRLGRLQDALATYDGVLAAAPHHLEAHVNRGNVLVALDRLDDAVAAYDRAIAGRPDYPKALIGRGAALQALNRHREALAAFDRVIALDKANADAHHNAALSLLVLGDFKRGFQEYEWRWKRTGMPAQRATGKPVWLGEFPLTRRTILLHAEQGLGDTIQFVRYATTLARGGANVIVQAPRELQPLLARVEGVAAVVARGESLPSFDVQCPLGSLPLALRTDVSTIPAEKEYLKTDAQRVATWRARIDERLASEDRARPRVAIVWSGSASHANDRNRSLPLAALAPLLSSDQAHFISLQRDLRDGDAMALAGLPNVVHLGADLDDFDDTAAIVSLVDLVISVDTSVAHLAGALGRPVWILTPFAPDWRWMLDRDDTPWYPSARLFRQPKPGDWDTVIARVLGEIAQHRTTV